jgi:tol-pal system protein YbgF
MMTYRRLIPALGAVALLAAGGAAWAQDASPSQMPANGGDRGDRVQTAERTVDEPPKARLDRFEKQLREVRQIVLQARATGKPVEVREAGPDPDVSALQAKFDDLDQSLRSLTGQFETLSHDVDLLKKDDAASHAQAAALADRVDKLEKLVTNITAPPPPPPGAEPATPQATAAPAGDPGGPKAAYAKAHQMMLDGDYDGAATAFQAFLDQYGDTSTAPLARYWLGQVKYTQKDYGGAVTAFIGAIRGWPQTSWAPDAMVKLSLALVELNKQKDACGALAELDRHYPKASPTTKTHASAARVRAGCAAR